MVTFAIIEAFDDPHYTILPNILLKACRIWIGDVGRERQELMLALGCSLEGDGWGFSAERSYIYIENGMYRRPYDKKPRPIPPMHNILANMHLSRCGENGPGPSLLIFWNFK